MSSGLLDTSVIIDWDDPAVLEALPDEVAMSAITVAELAAGPHLASTAAEAASRQARLQEVESKFEPIPFDAAAARSYGQTAAAAAAADAGRKHRRRVADLMIAATAHASGLDLYTRNVDDFAGLEHLVTVVEI
jgi:predicted nucleic acid-binding protein